MKWRYRKEMVPVARDLRWNETDGEHALWEILRDRRCGGWRFTRQVPMGRFVLDFYCASVKLAIEIDGSVHDNPDISERDTERQQMLELEYGIVFLRLTNEQVIRDPLALICLIDEAAKTAQLRLASLPFIERPR